ncbi:ubiquitin-conjugating enzyme/RWD-like protein, partial [Flammula alnicola]
GTPYAGGYFRVKFKFTEEFPAAPPKCWFATKIFHPNVGANGEICVNTLKKDWKSTYGIEHILVTSALDEEAGKLLLEEYSSYCDRAKLITSVHATPRVKPVEFNKPSAQEAESSSSKDPTKDASSKPTTDKTSLPVASTSKLAHYAHPLPSPVPSPHLYPPLRRSASPAPQMCLKASLSSEKEGLGVGPQKDRYPSPSPLGTADANVGNGKPGMGVGIGMASTAGMGGATGTKAVKRAATGSGVTGAEKRKKALKRL